MRRLGLPRRSAKRPGLPHRSAKREGGSPFDVVAEVGLTMPGVTAVTRYDGSPVLKADGAFMAGLASHESAEPASLVVRSTFEDRRWLLEDAPDIYYLTDYYRKHPLVLARLAQLDREALRDLLAVSRRLTLAKRPLRGQRTQDQGPRTKD
jgi:hypothetical protein